MLPDGAQKARTALASCRSSLQARRRAHQRHGPHLCLTSSSEGPPDPELRHRQYLCSDVAPRPRVELSLRI